MKRIISLFTNILKNNKSEHPCKKCGSICCKHIALEIDKPKTKQEIDQVRWYLLHKNVEVFIDNDKNWFLKFATNCKELSNGLCKSYTKRPKICKDYPNKDNYCEFEGEGNYFLERFLDEKSFLKYLNLKNKKIHKKL